MSALSDPERYYGAVAPRDLSNISIRSDILPSGAIERNEPRSKVRVFRIL
jgi:hypothetical protein